MDAEGKVKDNIIIGYIFEFLKDHNFNLKRTVLFRSTMQFHFVSYATVNVPFREIRNWLSHAKKSFAKHEISPNKEHFFAKYKTRFA